mmetsp:Transcript_13185/g.41600  ORF Transcript_13185/g.41600 Transcript_13185/m.41600 type:complete len:269 (-) Transcript_13185:284-1090(-)
MPGLESKPWLLRFMPNTPLIRDPRPMATVATFVHSSNISSRFRVQLIEASKKRMLSSILPLSSEASAMISSAVRLQLYITSSTKEHSEASAPEHPSCSSRPSPSTCSIWRRPCTNGRICSMKAERAIFSGYSFRMELNVWFLTLSSMLSTTGLVTCSRRPCIVTAAQTMHSTVQQLKPSSPSKVLVLFLNSWMKAENVELSESKKVTLEGSTTARTKSVRTQTARRETLRRKSCLELSLRERRLRQMPSLWPSSGQSSFTRSTRRIRS